MTGRSGLKEERNGLSPEQSSRHIVHCMRKSHMALPFFMPHIFKLQDCPSGDEQSERSEDCSIGEANPFHLQSIFPSLMAAGAAIEWLHFVPPLVSFLAFFKKISRFSLLRSNRRASIMISIYCRISSSTASMPHSNSRAFLQENVSFLSIKIK